MDAYLSVSHLGGSLCHLPVYRWNMGSFEFSCSCLRSPQNDRRFLERRAMRPDTPSFIVLVCSTFTIASIALLHAWTLPIIAISEEPEMRDIDTAATRGSLAIFP